MQLLNLLTLLPAVTSALPFITNHQTLSSNPIQIHNAPSTKRHTKDDFIITPTNTTRGFSLSPSYLPYASYRSSSDGCCQTANVSLSDVLEFMVGNHSAKYGALVEAAEKAHAVMTLYEQNTATLQQVSQCLSYVGGPTADGKAELEAWTHCMRMTYMAIITIPESATEKRDFADTELAPMREMEPIADQESKTAADVEGHSVGFWSRLLPQRTPAEISSFLSDLGGFYSQKKAGTHTSQTNLGKRDAPDSTQLSVEEKKEDERLEKPKVFSMTKGAMVRNGHWDGNMRFKDLDKVVECGEGTYTYLNERCVTSSQSQSA